MEISPTVAASLCMKPTPTLTPSEAAKVVALKEASPSFVEMRRLATTKLGRRYCVRSKSSEPLHETASILASASRIAAAKAGRS